jgi:20S proteasome alpha/beta subunit
MTVCIAALADGGRSLVLVCDGMLSTEWFSGDRTADKLFPIHRSWWAMIAGNSLSHVAPVIESATLLLSMVPDEENTLVAIMRCMTMAYQNERAQRAESLVLSPIGLTWKTFREKPEWQPHLAERLNSVDLGFTVLVGGFDWNMDGHIFTVDNPGVAANYDVAGWAAIGSGEYGVASTLLGQSFNPQMDLARAVYHACEAKFVSESAPGVGHYTQVKIPTPGVKDDAAILADESVAIIRKAWKEEGRPRVPRGLVDVIRRELAKRTIIS